jgi:hypothetical protein
MAQNLVLEKHRSKLNVVGMSFLRAMCGKNRFDRVRIVDDE